MVSLLNRSTDLPKKGIVRVLLGRHTCRRSKQFSLAAALIKTGIKDHWLNKTDSVYAYVWCSFMRL